MLNLSDFATLGAGGVGGLVQGIAAGVHDGMVRVQQERKLAREEDAQKTAMYLKGLDMILQNPQIAPAAAPIFEKYGFKLPQELMDNVAESRAALGRVSSALIAGQEANPQDLQRLMEDPRAAKIMEGLGPLLKVTGAVADRRRQAGAQTSFVSKVTDLMAKNPGLTREEAARQVAGTTTDPAELQHFLGDPKKGYHGTFGPELSAKDKEIRDAAPKVEALFARVRAGELSYEEAANRIAVLPGGKDAVAASPTFKAFAAQMTSSSAAPDLVGGLRRAPLNLGDVAGGPGAGAAASPATAGRPRLALPGMNESLSFGGFRPQLEAAGIANLGDVVSDTPPPARTLGDVKAEQAKREAVAKVTPLDQRRVAVAERQATASERRAGASETSATTGAAREKRLADAGARVAATIKTLEADAVRVAQSTFPDEKDATKRRALLEWMNNRTKGFGQMLSQDKDPAALEAELAQAIAKLKGEIDATPAGAAKTAAERWFTGFKDFLRGGSGTDDAPAAPASTAARRPGPVARPAPKSATAAPTFDNLPDPAQYAGRTVRDSATGKRYRSEGGRWVPAPAPADVAPPTAASQDPATLKAVRDKTVAALFPGRAWGELTAEEKNQVAARLNGAR